MPLTVLRRPLARRDLIEIWNYIADRNEAAADRFFDEIEGVLAMLAEHLAARRARVEIDDDLRSFPVGSYTLFCSIAAETIVVTRVVNGYRNLNAVDLV